MGRGRIQRRPAIRRTCFVFVAVGGIGTRVVYVLMVGSNPLLARGKNNSCLQTLCIFSYCTFISDFLISGVLFKKRSRLHSIGKFISFQISPITFLDTQYAFSSITLTVLNCFEILNMKLISNICDTPFNLMKDRFKCMLLNTSVYRRLKDVHMYTNSNTVIQFLSFYYEYLKEFSCKTWYKKDAYYSHNLQRCQSI